jgi:hypothetical protein
LIWASHAFACSYIYALLTAFRATDSTQLHVTRQISGSSIDWTLGYLIASLSTGGALSKAGAAWSPLIGLLSGLLLLVGAMLLKATYAFKPSKFHASHSQPDRTN